MDVAAVNCIDSTLRELRKKYYKHMGCDRDSDDYFFNSVNKITTDWELLKMIWELLLQNRKKRKEVSVVQPDNDGIEAEYLGSKIEHLAEKLAHIYKEEMNKNKDKEKYLAKELVQLAIDCRRRSEDLFVSEIKEVIGQWSLSSWLCKKDLSQKKENSVVIIIFGQVLSIL